jgi:hypothetical protein
MMAFTRPAAPRGIHRYETAPAEPAEAKATREAAELRETIKADGMRASEAAFEARMTALFVPGAPKSNPTPVTAPTNTDVVEAIGKAVGKAVVEQLQALNLLAPTPLTSQSTQAEFKRAEEDHKADLFVRLAHFYEHGDPPVVLHGSPGNAYNDRAWAAMWETIEAEKRAAEDAQKTRS